MPSQYKRRVVVVKYNLRCFSLVALYEKAMHSLSIAESCLRAGEYCS